MTTTLTARCSCGETFHADADRAGQRVRCRRCGTIVTLAAASAPHATPHAPPPRPDAPRPRDDASPRGRRRRRRSHTSDPLATMRARVAAWRARRPHRGPRPRSRRAWVSVTAWAYLAAVTLVAATMWGLGDRTWVGTVLLFMGRWVWLLPLVALVPLAAALRPRALLPLLAGALLVLGPVMGGRTGWRTWLASADDADAPFRVVTLNVGGDRGAGATVAAELPYLLAAWEADIVAFQECGPALQASVAATPAWGSHVSNGLCLLSRHPIDDVAVMDRAALARNRETSASGGAGFVVRYRLRTPSGPVAVTNLHLETPRRGLEGLWRADLDPLRANTVVRDLEARLARRWVARDDAPTIVLGDFNTPAESRIFREHWGDLANAFAQAGRGFGMTKRNGWIQARIDHVLVDDAWRVRAADVGIDVGSDHLPLVVDLERVAR